MFTNNIRVLTDTLQVNLVGSLNPNTSCLKRKTTKRVKMLTMKVEGNQKLHKYI